MRQYQFVTGISLVLLETEINRMAAEEPLMRLKQILHVQGSGFVAVLERKLDDDAVPAEPVRPSRPKPDPVKPRKDSVKEPRARRRG
jgi:hypothetical protein